MTRWLLALALCVSLSAHAAIFKCKKADGSFMYQENPCAAETQSAGTVNTGGGGVEMDSTDPRDAKAAFYIDQAANGHYFVDGTINGQPLNFLVDTGATTVAIPSGLANFANLHCTKYMMSSTANGNAVTCKTVISKLTFGKFILHDVEAAILPGATMPLLGMSVLSRFNVEQRNGQLVLTRP
ncbi:MAG TPA: retropepsin-like aspartic protease [Gallionellaceae bacterium]|nr:retropepsin-like aspartic protease [Gallionellaceae bacterium]